MTLPDLIFSRPQDLEMIALLVGIVVAGVVIGGIILSTLRTLFPSDTPEHQREVLRLLRRLKDDP